MAELAPEDALRLNVLLAGELHAVRIDEAGLVVHGLTSRGEAAVRLHPTGRVDQYLRLVRELLAGHAIGSPGGYPVYLQRWTRMGQARDKGLDRLLLFGEPEAVVSVAYSNGLTDELARRAWWAMPVADNARRMLERQCVVEGRMGRILADHLIEHLPFESNPYLIIDTVRLVLQPGLTDESVRKQLWRKGGHDNAYYVGFLERMPDDLPEPDLPRHDWDTVSRVLEPLIAEGNITAMQLERTLSGSGQSFLRVAEAVLRYPADQDVVNALLNAVAAYFSPIRPVMPVTGLDSAEAVIACAQALCSDPAASADRFLERFPDYAAEVQAMLALSCMDSGIASSILSRTTASGTLLRQKLEPVSMPVLKCFAVLRGQTFDALVPGRRKRIS